MPRIPHLRWWIVALIFGASVLNYVDRQALSILAPTIKRSRPLQRRLRVRSQLVSHRLHGRAHRLRKNRGPLWRSLESGPLRRLVVDLNILTGFARSLGSLAACRFFLGLGEAGNWTAAPKAVSEWFPARERGLAIGVYTLGATVGATLAPILIVGLASWHSWQAAFIVTGSAGLLWLIPWLWLYRRPSEHPRLSTEERTLIESGQAAELAANPAAVPDWGKWHRVLLRREVLLLIFARMLTDPVWYFSSSGSPSISTTRAASIKNP